MYASSGIVAAPQFTARVTGALAQAGDGVLQELEVVMWATGEDAGAFAAEGLGFPQAAYEAECRVFADRIDYQAFLRPAAWGGSLPYMQYYTSGTTGRPKAVVLQNSIVCTHAAAAAEEMGLNFSDVWGHFAPMFHLVDAFAMYSITMVGGTHVDLTSLRIVSCGGSPLPPANVLTAVAHLGCQFFISYGMTETCGKISMSLLSPAVRARPLPEQVQMLCSSGRPFTLTDVRVLSPEGVEVAPGAGEIGEGGCRGPTVFNGYHLHEGDPYQSFHGGWFRTGDLAQVESSGYLRIVDRAKDMILCGGENVYCVEVESVLARPPAVGQAAVFGLPNDLMGEMVTAAVVLKDAAPAVSPAELIAHCRASLADYKVPYTIHVLPELPKTGSGKVQKRDLRDRFSQPGAAARAGASAPVAAVQPVADPAAVLEDIAAVSGNPVLGAPAALPKAEAGAAAVVAVGEAGEGALRGVLSVVIAETVIVLVPALPSADVVEALRDDYAGRETLFLSCEVGRLRDLSHCALALLDGSSTLFLANFVSASGSLVNQSNASSTDIQTIEQKVSKAVEDILGHSVDFQTPLMNAGMTSVTSVTLTSSLESLFGIEAPATLAFDYPSISLLAQYVNGVVGSADLLEGPDSAGVAGMVLEAVQTMTGVDVAQDEPLTTAGVSSAMATALVDALEGIFHTNLPSTLVFDYPSVSSIAAYLTENGLGGKAAAARGTAAPQVPSVTGAALPHRAVGMTPVVSKQWEQGGSAADRIEMFDSGAFSMSEIESAMCDPQQRFLLESSSEALLHSLPGSRSSTGVYVGISMLEYAWTVTKHIPLPNTYTATSAHLSVSSGRLSYTFGLRGPAVTVDTACSSSLVALHRGGQRVALNTATEGAIVSGANATIALHWSLACSRAGMLSPDGRCKTLDGSADGYVRSEGCFSTFLSLLGDRGAPPHIAIMKGSAVNQDGRSSSLTAPSGPSQLDVIQEAVRSSDLKPGSVDAVQLHGTGTALGDPIEIGALSSAMFSDAGSDRMLSLQASKSIVGHAEPAAGMVSLFMAVAAVRAATSPGITHLSEMNTHIKAVLDSNPIALRNLQASKCESATPVKASGMSSFAFMGTNAHSVIGCTAEPLSIAMSGSEKRVSGEHWVRSDFWILPWAHPFLQKGTSSAFRGTVEVEMDACNASNWSISDHVVQGRVLFPAAAFFEFSTAFSTASPFHFDRHACRPEVCLQAIAIPMALDLSGSRESSRKVVAVMSLQTGSFTVHSREGRNVHVRGAAVCSPRLSSCVESVGPPRSGSDLLLSRSSRTRSGAAVIPCLERNFVMSPGELDSAIHLNAGIKALRPQSWEVHVPTSLDCLSVSSGKAVRQKEVTAAPLRVPGGAGSNHESCTVQLSGSGNSLSSLHNLTLTKMGLRPRVSSPTLGGVAAQRSAGLPMYKLLWPASQQITDQFTAPCDGSRDYRLYVGGSLLKGHSGVPGVGLENASMMRTLASFLCDLQSLGKGAISSVVLLTNDASPVESVAGTRLSLPAAAGLWGILRCAAAEAEADVHVMDVVPQQDRSPRLPDARPKCA